MMVYMLSTTTVECSVLVLLDLRVAFHTVDHSILILMQWMGISGWYSSDNSFKGISYHCSADHSHLYTLFNPQNVAKLLVLQNCLNSKKLYADIFLQLKATVGRIEKRVDLA